jgi:hypothetical protein
MPVTAKIISAAIMANFASSVILGRNAIDIADAVGTGVAVHITTPNMLTFACSGTAGPVGTASSLVVAGIVPTAMTGLMMTRAAQVGFGIGGRDMQKMFSAISKGVAAVLNGSLVQGNFGGLALGGGTARFTKINAQILNRLIQANLASKGMIGRDVGKISDCISYGIVNQLKAGATFTILVSGAIAPVPPVGPLPMAGLPAVYSKIV